MNVEQLLTEIKSLPEIGLKPLLEGIEEHLERDYPHLSTADLRTRLDSAESRNNDLLDRNEELATQVDDLRAWKSDVMDMYQKWNNIFSVTS